MQFILAKSNAQHMFRGEVKNFRHIIENSK